AVVLAVLGVAAAAIAGGALLLAPRKPLAVSQPPAPPPATGGPVAATEADFEFTGGYFKDAEALAAKARALTKEKRLALAWAAWSRVIDSTDSSDKLLDEARSALAVLAKDVPPREGVPAAQWRVKVLIARRLQAEGFDITLRSDLEEAVREAVADFEKK